jgi:hypothetical protein
VTEWAAAELRIAVLEALGPHADERARDAVQSGTVSIAPSVARWESSAGPIEGHRVVLAVDAGRLGKLRASHASVDAVAAAFVAVVATRPGQAMADLSLEWSGQGDVMESGYRGAQPTAVSLETALVTYLVAAGEADTAHDAAGAMVTRRGAEVRVVLAPEPRKRVRARAGAEGAIVRAVRDLAGDAHLRVTVDG